MFASGSRTADERGPQSRPNLPMEISSLPTGVHRPVAGGQVARRVSRSTGIVRVVRCS